MLLQHFQTPRATYTSGFVTINSGRAPSLKSASTGTSGSRKLGTRLTPSAATPESNAIPTTALRNTSIVSRVRLNTTSKCELAVGVYPKFAYNAAGGGGYGSSTQVGDGVYQVTFDPQTLLIPALGWQTGSLFKLPIPPFINIDIRPQRLEGTVNIGTGEVNLEFDAEFLFTATPLYTAPPLVIRTLLTTESTQGNFLKGQGSRLAGRAVKLVGTSDVPKTGDWFLDAFLMLPTDALAVMDAQLSFE